MNKRIIFGIVIVVIMGLGAVFAPQVATHNPYQMNLSQEARLQAPSAEHFFGTDNLGRDTFSRMVYGARISLSVGFIAVFISLVLEFFWVG